MDPIVDYWTGLLAFVRSAESGSFTAASRVLGMTPSAVGRAVTRLERRLGATLLKRSTRSLGLTPEGRLLLDQVGPAMAALRDAEGAVSGTPVATGTVRVSAPIDLGRMLVASWATAFASDHPGVILELNVTDRLIDLRREGVDVAIRLGSLPPSTLATDQIGTIGYALVAAPSYLAKHDRPQSISDLSKHACLQYLALDGAPLKWTFEGQELATTGPFATDDGGALLTAAIAGAGIAYMLRFAVVEAVAGERLIELLPAVSKAELPVSLSHPYGARPPARVRVVTDFLRMRLAQGGVSA